MKKTVQSLAIFILSLGFAQSLCMQTPALHKHIPCLTYTAASAVDNSTLMPTCLQPNRYPLDMVHAAINAKKITVDEALLWAIDTQHTDVAESILAHMPEHKHSLLKLKNFYIRTTHLLLSPKRHCRDGLAIFDPLRTKTTSGLSPALIRTIQEDDIPHSTRLYLEKIVHDKFNIYVADRPINGKFFNQIAQELKDTDADSLYTINASIRFKQAALAFYSFKQFSEEKFMGPLKKESNQLKKEYAAMLLAILQYAQ